MLGLSVRDKASVSPDFFSVLSSEDDSMTLLSTSTGHIWRLDHVYGRIMLYHKHHMEDDFHYQTECLDVYNTVTYILEHDNYQLNKSTSLHMYSLQWRSV